MIHTKTPNPRLIMGIALAAMLAVGLAACGGGDDSPADETSVTITGFTMAPAALTPPTSGSTSVNSSIVGTFKMLPEKSITLSAYAIPASAPTTALGPSNRYLNKTCSFALASICGGTECTFSSGRALSCTSGSLVNLQPGGYVMVARMCVQNQSNTDVCDEERLNVTVN